MIIKYVFIKRMHYPTMSRNFALFFNLSLFTLIDSTNFEKFNLYKN